MYSYIFAKADRYEVYYDCRGENKGDLNPTGLVVSGDMLIVTDSKAYTVRLHRRHDGKLLAKTNRLGSWPRCICLINDMEICVILEKCQIEIMSIQCTGDTGVIRRLRTLHVSKMFDVCDTAVKFMDKVVVCGRQHDMICWCIVRLNDGHADTIHPICKGSWSYLTTKHNMIYISCWTGYNSPDSGVYGYDIQNLSKQKLIYIHKNLKEPHGITVDIKGFIFVCNNSRPSCIHHLTDRCELVTIYWEGIPSFPCDIFWDQHHGDLYVASWTSNVITRYKQKSYEQDNIRRNKSYHGHETRRSGRQTADSMKSRDSGFADSSPNTTIRDVDTWKIHTNDNIRRNKSYHGHKTRRSGRQTADSMKSRDSGFADSSPNTTIRDVDTWKIHTNDLQDEETFLEVIRSDTQNVEEMIRNQKIPKKSIVKVAMKRDRYCVQQALFEMSKMLRREISDAVGVWCGYKPEDVITPVFVVTLKSQKCILKEEDIPEPFRDYDIIIRHKHVPNDEERSIVEQYGSNSVRSEDVSHVNNCIATHTKRLMKEHSNLSIIRPCSIKAFGYMTKEMKVKQDTCIVFYVPVKGIIPIGENEFPKCIDGIVTDVREGEFLLFGGHNAMEYHSKLRIGCFITNGRNIGTLGGFVDLPGEKVGCLTAAHVVLTEEQIQQYINMENETKRKLNDDLAQEIEPIEMYQPAPSETFYKPFGKVHTIALEEGNSDTPSIDAAIIQITDDDRKPETGTFPDNDCRDFGLTKDDPLLYAGGEILDDTYIHPQESLVIKFGCTTGLTQGQLNCSECSVRRVDVYGHYCFPVMYKQLEVLNQQHVFAAAGDSGSMVFLCVGGNIRNLHAVGLVIGENSTGCSCVITPIKAVFEKLGLTSNKFKVFPASQLSQLREHINAQRQALSKQNEVLNRLSQTIESIEQKMVDTIEEKVNSLKQKIDEHSGLSETFFSKVNTLETNIKESSEKINSRVDTLEKNITCNINESFTKLMEVFKQTNNKS